LSSYLALFITENTKLLLVLYISLFLGIFLDRCLLPGKQEISLIQVATTFFEELTLLIINKVSTLTTQKNTRLNYKSAFTTIFKSRNYCNRNLNFENSSVMNFKESIESLHRFLGILGSISPTCLREAFTCADPKAQIGSQVISVVLRFWYLCA